MEIKINNAIESLVKKASPHGNGAKVLVPKSWIGKQVQIVLLDDA
jgi:putative transposon-encoded protein